MAYDPSLYAASAPHYLKGRPPYSAALLDVLRAELGLDGTGVLLDAGCGPGVLAVQLGAAFGAVIGLDPDAAMLDAAAGHAAAHRVEVTWVHARAEDIPTLGLPPARLVTFGQSFHWTDRRLVVDAVFDVLEPGGSLALVSHDIAAGPPPVRRPEPPIPHDEIRALIARYLGPARRAGSGLRTIDDERDELSLSRSRFGPPREVHAPGRADIVRRADEVVSNYLSMSYAAPHLFGPDLDAFVADLRRLLAAASPAGTFWDWPGHTSIIVAAKPS